MCGYCWSGGPCSSESLESLDLAECADALDPAGLVWLKCSAAESASWHSRQCTSVRDIYFRCRLRSGVQGSRGAEEQVDGACAPDNHDADVSCMVCQDAP